MAGHIHRRSTIDQTLRVILSLLWKLLLATLVLLAVALAIPAYGIGTRLGLRILPSVTDFFYKYSTPASPTPSPPAFPAKLPQIGSLLYTVQQGDSCDGILATQMQLLDAGEIFTDLRPNTVQALDAAIGQNCHALQPGMVLALSPQYPLVAFGGIVLRIDATSPQEVIPTPLIPVPTEDQTAADCSGGCMLTVQIASNVKVHLVVQTTLSLHPGAWVWAQAMMARKVVPDFDNYPYVDPKASLNGMLLRACDFQVENTYDENAPSCEQLSPNTIAIDGGAWLFGAVGSTGLDHWRYPLKLRAGTQVLLWLSDVNGHLKFEAGNPVFRYDEVKHVYVHM